MSAFTRQQLADMPPDELMSRIGEINEWAAAGAVDGQEPPALRRPDGHKFTAAEIGAMPLAEFEANVDLINAWLAAGSPA